MLFSKYYFEPKVTASVPVGSLSLNAILGWVCILIHHIVLLNTVLAYVVGNLTYALTYSNFDKALFNHQLAIVLIKNNLV
jgi:tetrahydromethanopterin S-methyltransferase subunit C